MSTILVNGEAAASIDAMDRAVQYGDGLFETLACDRGEAQRLNEHLQRMRAGCERLLLAYPGDAVFIDDIRDLLQGTQQRRVVKLMLTRGIGRRGYRFDANAPPTRISLVSAWPAHIDTWRKNGIRVQYCATPVSVNARLAGIKHLNRLDSVMAAAELGDAFDEGLMLDHEGHIIEGTMSNVFAWIGDELHTPATDRCGIDGILRDAVLRYARQSGITVLHGRLTLQDMQRAAEVFVTNSVIGICPVVRLGGAALHIGERTRRLQLAIK